MMQSDFALKSNLSTYTFTDQVPAPGLGNLHQIFCLDRHGTSQGDGGEEVCGLPAVQILLSTKDWGLQVHPM